MTLSRQTSRRGAAMSEFVLVLPLLVVIFALLLYFGRLMVRVERASQMARYETWRNVQQAPGPYVADPGQGVNDTGSNQPLMNQTFFGGKATWVRRGLNGTGFPNDPYDQMIQAAGKVGPDAQVATQALMYRPDGDLRYSSGRTEGFSVFYQNTLDAWNRINAISRVENPVNPETEDTPLKRRHQRIGTDWSFTNSWKANDPLWPSNLGGGDANHPRGVRDAFFTDFDTQLDALDGPGNPEYGNGGGPEQPTGDTLAGLVRNMYLATPGYRGPTVYVGP